MKPLLRAIGVAVLATALLNASAGLCFCHHGPVAPGASPESAGCCHGPVTTGVTTLGTADSCCHVESAESAATPLVAVQLSPPASASVVVVDTMPAIEALRVAGASLTGCSPPPHVLRL